MSTPARRTPRAVPAAPSSVGSRRSTRLRGGAPGSITESSVNLPPLRASSLSYGGVPNHAVSSDLNVLGSPLSHAVPGNVLPGIAEEGEATRPATADETSSMIDRSKTFAEQREQGLRQLAANGNVHEPVVGPALENWVQNQRANLGLEPEAANRPAAGQYPWRQQLLSSFSTLSYLASLLLIGFLVAQALMRPSVSPVSNAPLNATPVQVQQVEARLSSLEASLSAVAPKWTNKVDSSFINTKAHIASNMRRLESLESEIARIRRSVTSPAAAVSKQAVAALREINFFSPKLGAYINRKYTSPTLSSTANWRQKLYSSLVWIPQPLPPAAVLEDWDDAADAWCAAASQDGKGLAQVGITFPRGMKVTPTHWTVEHMWREGTFDIRTAPKHLELWLHLTSVADADKVRDHRADRGNQGYPEYNRCSDANGLKDPRFVCVGTAKYSITGLAHVQTFDLDIDLKALGVAADEAVVRVTENHGREHTCLYRLRLHGVLAGMVRG